MTPRLKDGSARVRCRGRSEGEPGREGTHRGLGGWEGGRRGHARWQESRQQPVGFSLRSTCLPERLTSCQGRRPTVPSPPSPRTLLGPPDTPRMSLPWQLSELPASLQGRCRKPPGNALPHLWAGVAEAAGVGAAQRGGRRGQAPRHSPVTSPPSRVVRWPQCPAAQGHQHLRGPQGHSSLAGPPVPTALMNEASLMGAGS